MTLERALPLLNHNNQPVDVPEAIYSTPTVLDQGVPQQEVLVQWQGYPFEKTLWEPFSEFYAAYLYFNLEDKVIFYGGGKDTIMTDVRNIAYKI